MTILETEEINCKNCSKAKMVKKSKRRYGCEEKNNPSKLASLFKNPSYYHKKAKNCDGFDSMGEQIDPYEDDYEALIKRELKSKGVDIEAIQ